MNRQLKHVSISLAVIAALLTLAACATGAPAASAGNGSDSPHTISVSGNGTAYGTPDLATINIGVQSRHTDAAAAVAENTNKMNAITAALAGLGIEAKDIQTTNFSVYPQQEYDPQTGQATGVTTYVVDNSVNVVLRDLNNVGAALGRATEAGANSIYGISFGVSDPAKLEAEARAKAMADAKARAEQLAQAAGVTLDVPMNISEYSSGPIPYAVDSKAALGVGGGGSVPVSSGQLQISLSVNITYIIK